MIIINWTRDYKGEFVCPYCLEPGLKIQGWTKRKTKNKKLFRCQKCSKSTPESYDIKLCNPEAKINWKQDYKIGEFACPYCEARNMRLKGFDNGKQQFYCLSCQTTTGSSINLCHSIVNRITHCKPKVKPFYFDDYEWDLRALIPSVNERYNGFYLNFKILENQGFIYLVKQYIYHLCKTGNSPGTIHRHFSHLKKFSGYLSERNIRDINEINRDSILDYLVWDGRENTPQRHLLGVLRNFFLIGNLQGWFEIDYEIIRHDDYPKKKVKNPDPISDKVRQQIENNLCKLPDPLARMWLIAFFTAMRPGELALLRKDCLVQEGSNWKIVWNCSKGKDQHEVPITRIIAKVIQAQQEYIQQVWGDDWDYLFCHYQGLSETDPSQAGIEPVKKVIPPSRSPLYVAICCLIKAFDIRDENGRIAKFSLRLVRPTRLTQLFNQGHDLAVVSAWAGHKSSRTTVLHYTEISCDQIEKEAGHIQKILFNADGQPLRYESLPLSFAQNPHAHELNLSGDHINTPIYGYCGLPLDFDCHKFRACYTCKQHFVAIREKLPLYIKTRDELRAKEVRARANSSDVLVEQFSRQADQLDKIIASLETA